MADLIPSDLFGPLPILEEINVERQRQIQVEGYTPEQDDERDLAELADAAACYALAAADDLDACDYVHDTEADLSVPRWWPFEAHEWKPKGARRDLVRAAALIVAEIQRLDREAALEASNPVRPCRAANEPADSVTPQQAADLRLKRAEAAFRGVQDRMADAMCELRDAAMAAGALKTSMPAAGDRGESIFPTFDVHVPLPADTSVPASEADEELRCDGEGSTS